MDIAKSGGCPQAAPMQFDSIPPLSLLVGSRLTELTRREYDWVFLFAGGVTVVAQSSHWRLVDGGTVIITDEDHGQLFGLKEPVDAANVAPAALSGASVSRVEFSAVSDLLLSFSNGRTLQVIIGSASYENWHVYGPDTRIRSPSAAGSFAEKSVNVRFGWKAAASALPVCFLQAPRRCSAKRGPARSLVLVDRPF